MEWNILVRVEHAGESGGEHAGVMMVRVEWSMLVRVQLASDGESGAWHAGESGVEHAGESAAC